MSQVNRIFLIPFLKILSAVFPFLPVLVLALETPATGEAIVFHVDPSYEDGRRV